MNRHGRGWLGRGRQLVHHYRVLREQLFSWGKRPITTLSEIQIFLLVSIHVQLRLVNLESSLAGTK